MDTSLIGKLGFSFLSVGLVCLIACGSYYGCNKGSVEASSKAKTAFWACTIISILVLVAGIIMTGLGVKGMVDEDKSVAMSASASTAAANQRAYEPTEKNMTNYQAAEYTNRLGEAEAITRNNDFTQTFVRGGAIGAPYSVTTNRRLVTLNDPDVSDTWDTTNLYSEYTVT